MNWFLEYSKGRTYLLLNRRVYEMVDYKTKNYLKINNYRTYFEKSETLEKLEMILSPQEIHQDLISNIFDRDFTQPTKQIIKNIIPLGAKLVSQDQLIELEENKSGKIRLEKRSYRITNKRVKFDDIQRRADRWCSELSMNEEFYDHDLNLGYKIIGKHLYVYMLVEPFEIEDRKVQARIVFPTAELAIKVTQYDETIQVKGFYILNNYTHPGLPHKSLSLQKLCSGQIKIRRLPLDFGPKLKLEIKEILSVGKEILTRGYRRDSGYYNLEEIIQ